MSYTIRNELACRLHGSRYVHYDDRRGLLFSWIGGDAGDITSLYTGGLFGRFTVPARGKAPDPEAGVMVWLDNNP